MNIVGFQHGWRDLARISAPGGVAGTGVGLVQLDKAVPPTPPETLGADNKNSDGGNDLLLQILIGEMTEMQVFGSLSEVFRRSRDLEFSQQISLLELFQLWAGRCWQCRGTFWCEIART